MSFCPYCGVKNDDADIFCVSCNKPLKAPEKAEAQQVEPASEQKSEQPEQQNFEQPQQSPAQPVQPNPPVWQQPTQQSPPAWQQNAWQYAQHQQNPYQQEQLKPIKKTFYIVTLIFSIFFFNVLSLALSIAAVMNVSNYEEAVRHNDIPQANKIVDNCKLFMIISWVANILSIVSIFIGILLFAGMLFSSVSYFSEYQYSDFTLRIAQLFA